jgi:Ca2+-binding RTX toxin-like protein
MNVVQQEKRPEVKKSVLRWLAAVALVVVSGFVPTSRVTATSSLLDQCVANINDPLFDKAFLLGLTGFSTEAQFEASVASGRWTVQLATGSGHFGTHNGDSPDLYCGNSQNNSRDYLDSDNTSRDFFIGGAGDDSLTGTMWQSTIYGGEGNDYANDIQESSYFYGGPGNDSCVHWPRRQFDGVHPNAPALTCLAMQADCGTRCLCDYRRCA